MVLNWHKKWVTSQIFENNIFLLVLLYVLNNISFYREMNIDLWRGPRGGRHHNGRVSFASTTRPRYAPSTRHRFSTLQVGNPERSRRRPIRTTSRPFCFPAYAECACSVASVNYVRNTILLSSCLFFFLSSYFATYRARPARQPVEA